MASITSAVLSSDSCKIKNYHPESIAKGSSTSHVSNVPPRRDYTISIAKYHSDLDKILGLGPQFSLLLSSTDTSRNPFFHGGCAYVPQEDELFITSDLLQPVDPAQAPVILISRVKLHRGDSSAVTSVTWAKLRPPPSMPMPAGALPWSTTDAAGKTYSGVSYCSQGNLSSPGGIFSMQAGLPPYPHVTDFFGDEFGCLCSMAVYRPPDPTDWAEWFIDAGGRGFEAGFRRPPTLPAAVWRYNAVREDLRMMTDDVSSPWGIAISPDGDTVYVTDSNPVKNDAGVVQKNITAGIYAFDVITRHGQPFLTAKRLFARPAKGISKGVICDARGYVFAGCGDGVEIWNEGGVFLGVITIPEPVSSISWGREGEIFICADQTLWMLRFGPSNR